MLGNMKDALLYLRVAFILRHDFVHNMEFRTDSVVMRYKIKVLNCQTKQ